MKKEGFDIQYVLEKYEKKMGGVEYVLYPANNCKRLIILFAGIGKGQYNRVSWYWNKEEKWEETSYLFLKDDAHYYYVGTKTAEKASKYVALIKHIITELGIDSKQVYTVGGSMGGYGAIYYALYCNLKAAIAVHPQLDYQSARMHEFLQWEKLMRECSDFFYDLGDLLIKKGQSKPIIYLEHGDYPADKNAAHTFIDALKKLEQAILILRKTNSKQHRTNNPTQKTIESIIHFVENFGFDDEFIS